MLGIIIFSLCLATIAVIGARWIYKTGFQDGEIYALKQVMDNEEKNE